MAEDVISKLQNGNHTFSGKNNFNGSKRDLARLRLTIFDRIDHWLNYRKELFENGGLKKKTYLSCKHICTYFKTWLVEKQFSAEAVASLTQFDIALFLQHCSRKRRWNKVSYNTYRNLLITMFNYFIGLKLLSENPVKLTKKLNLKHDSSRFKIYSEHELKQVVNALESNDRFQDLYIAAKLIYKYNIRPIELIRIQVKDVSLDEHLLILPANKTKNGNEAKFTLDVETIEILTGYLKQGNPSLFIFGNKGKGSLFQTCDDYLGQRWRVFKKENNLPKHLKLYALKHSSNYYDLKGGASFEEIRQRNRHSNLQITTSYIKERLFKDSITGAINDKF